MCRLWNGSRLAPPSPGGHRMSTALHSHGVARRPSEEHLEFSGHDVREAMQRGHRRRPTASASASDPRHHRQAASDVHRLYAVDAPDTLVVPEPISRMNCRDSLLWPVEPAAPEPDLFRPDKSLGNCRDRSVPRVPLFSYASLNLVVGSLKVSQRVVGRQPIQKSTSLASQLTSGIDRQQTSYRFPKIEDDDLFARPG